MKIAELKTFVVGNPPPAFGGRYFLFLKLKTACGIEGVGEVYAASFAPKAIIAMIEDVFERHVEGADPFRIEALWRNVYGRGYSGRPDVSLMGVLSGIEMALWDIVGKAVGKPIYALIGGKIHERLRSPARTPIPTARFIRIRTPPPSGRLDIWHRDSPR
jgi:2-dehydro-3-deoxyphosphogalactonate aldolase